MTIGIAQTLLLIIELRIAMLKRTTGDRPELKLVNVGAAAIDIGSKMHMAAVNPACTDMPVRSFGDRSCGSDSRLRCWGRLVCPARSGKTRRFFWS